MFENREQGRLVWNESASDSVLRHLVTRDYLDIEYEEQLVVILKTLEWRDRGNDVDSKLKADQTGAEVPVMEKRDDTEITDQGDAAKALSSLRI
jgi:hypothetical protein